MKHISNVEYYSIFKKSIDARNKNDIFFIFLVPLY